MHNYLLSKDITAFLLIMDIINKSVQSVHLQYLQADGPDPSKIPESEIVGVTVLLLKCRYMEQEFINIGWFVATEYTTPELQEEPPATPDLDKVSILKRPPCSSCLLRMNLFTDSYVGNRDS